MTKKDLLEAIKDMPEDAEIRDYEDEVIDEALYDRNNNVIMLW